MSSDQLPLPMLDTDRARVYANNAAIATRAALANADVIDHIAAGRLLWTDADVRANPPVRWVFENGELFNGLGDVIDTVRYAGVRHLGDLVEVRPLDPTDSVHWCCIGVRLFDHHPRRVKFRQRAELKRQMGKHRPLVKLAMYFTKGRFLERIAEVPENAERIRELTGLTPGDFWRRARGT